MKIVEILNSLVKEYDLPVIVSTHPRTRKRLEMLGNVEIDQRIQFLKPFGFLDYNYLQLKAKCAISDSGTISEESSMLNFPAVTIRNSMERPEAIDAGTIIITGLIPEIVLDAIRLVIDEFDQRAEYAQICQEYQIENTSMRVLKTILGTTNLSNKWWGIYK
jgi:UDP-N-acetyl-L-fucosamine synthase